MLPKAKQSSTSEMADLISLLCKVPFCAFKKKSGIIVRSVVFALPDGPSALYPAELSPAIPLFQQRLPCRAQHSQDLDNESGVIKGALLK